MDLSDMLGSGKNTTPATNAPQADESPDEEDEEDGEELDDDPTLSGSDDEDEDGNLESLSAFVDSLAPPKLDSTKSTGSSEGPLEIPATSTTLSMADIVASLTDPSLQTFRKSLATQQTKTSKTQKLAPPLARPIKDKLERKAAYEEAKTEITKWQPIVKANREADHLHFPMNQPAKSSKHSTAMLAGTFEPSAPLEKTIDAMLQESGLCSEKEITSFEDLALKRVSVDEVRARQAQLQVMRELMFRQQQKASRIAKIKSKRYRKIHKRERERTRLATEEGLEGEDVEEEQMRKEAARAKERMTLRHKNTGEWAKKMLSRGQHDLGTRQAISEQIQRGDDLQQKILGTEELTEDDDSDSVEELEELEKLVQDPEKWGDAIVEVKDEKVRHGVLGMKFMRDAEDRQRQLNEEMVAELRAEMDGDEEALEHVSSATVNHGRKKFVPGDEVLPALRLD
jgi:U3 small nucleolar RNA-associated protein 14